MPNCIKNKEEFFLIKEELLTLEEYLKVARKIIFKEEIGYEMDYEELKYELNSCEERFQLINELLLKIECKINELEWSLENE